MCKILKKTFPIIFMSRDHNFLALNKFSIKTEASDHENAMLSV